MKKLFIPAKSDIDVLPVVEKALPMLGKRVGLITTIQHLHKLILVKEFLEKNRKKALVGGQVLGCNLKNAEGIVDKVDCLLYIGTGRFHPFGALMKTKKPIVCADPLLESVSVLAEKELERIEKRRMAAYVKFIDSENIGIILSKKPGQFNLRAAKFLEKQYKNKKFYYFVCDTLDMNELENFPFIECWVNTACPRIEDDFARSAKPIINLDELPKSQKVYK